MWPLKKKRKNVTNSPNDAPIDTTMIFTPSKADFLEMEERIIWTQQGDMYRYCVYTIFPQFNIGGAPILNIYGQKIYNDIMENKKGE